MFEHCGQTDNNEERTLEHVMYPNFSTILKDFIGNPKKKNMQIPFFNFLQYRILAKCVTSGHILKIRLNFIQLLSLTAL